MKTLVCLWFPMILAAQVKGRASDAETGSPVPYVNVWTENENVGMTGDSLGNYTIQTTNANKTIVFSAGGYETLKLRLPETRKVAMHKVKKVVDSTALPETHIIADHEGYKWKDIKLTYGSKGLPWIMAKYFAGRFSGSVTPFLNSATIMTDCVQENAMCRLRIMGVNPDGTPGGDLIDKSIVVKLEKGRKELEINLEKYRLRYPGNGVFVGVEWLILPQNVRHRNERNLPGPKLYDPSIGAIGSQTETTWVYSLGQWQPFGKSSITGLKEFRDQYVNLAINITFSN